MNDGASAILAYVCVCVEGDLSASVSTRLHSPTSVFSCVHLSDYVSANLSVLPHLVGWFACLFACVLNCVLLCNYLIVVSSDVRGVSG